MLVLLPACDSRYLVESLPQVTIGPIAQRVLVS
jgi:hypothetical protein